MKRIVLLLFIPFYCSMLLAQSDFRQTNTPGGEIMADAPYRMKKYDSSGNLQGIPVHIFAHNANSPGTNIELMNISIKIKNASDTVFQDLIGFSDYPDSLFDALLICRSPLDSVLDIQSFEGCGAVKDTNYTINFTSDHNEFPYTTFVDITHDFWWFTIMIPPDKLVGYDNIVDFEVYMELDWDLDKVCYLRVFRSEYEYPKMENWYRGDVHYHAMFTQNDAEIGLPLVATKQAAKLVGLDWITISDHSCDFDNYGQNMYDNWYFLGNEVSLLNVEDTSMLFIRAIEMSVNNTAGDIIHALVYPSPENPFSLPYPGDGGGDLFSTDVNIDDLIDSLVLHDAFCYAAHPFAEKDALHWIIGGGLWNISDNEFPVNGSPFPHYGTVACNDTNYSSDLFSPDSSFLIKQSISGGQIWNVRNARINPDEADNPWNATYSSSTSSFSPLEETDILHHLVRLQQNMDVVRHVWQKGLRLKNTLPSAQNWKFFISAGSDAHGSFNYSNTELSFGITGYVSDNAIGKLSTLVYCPQGMGIHGSNVLSALKNGNTILSSGPIITVEISTYNDSVIIPGMDFSLTVTDIQNADLLINTATSDEYGQVDSILINGITWNSSYRLSLPVASSLSYNLYDLLSELFYPGNVPEDEYFLIYAELHTAVVYDQPQVYRMESQRFMSVTNPIWIRLNNPVADSWPQIKDCYFNVFPNPASDNISIQYFLPEETEVEINVVDLHGRTIARLLHQKQKAGFHSFPANLDMLSNGIYLIETVLDDNWNHYGRLAVIR
ncbi:MAG: T9SS type A sorting domain-containing protein [Bacteroidetes bacterium]|nr:T9SS type A sorting domain-containing protein [Bacteroidota bacterium]